MFRNYGVSRVLEPKGVVPAAAWKIDNDREIRSREARINLEKIHLEWDSFQQLCSSCGFDDDKIKAKIMDIIEKRGKLHNPFTGTGGVFMGTIDEISEDMEAQDGEWNVGDRICCITSLCCLPIYIESILDIDYQYGQFACTGYGIVFEASPVYTLESGLALNYSLSAMDEAGNLYGAHNIAIEHNNRNIAIIGRNIHTTLLYAAALREAIGPQYRVVAVMDESVKDGMSQKDVEAVLYPLIKETYFVDLSEPLKSHQYIVKKGKCSAEVDQVIVAEDIFGTETLAVMMVKAGGDVYFTAVENHYATAQLAAESMGKSVTMYASDQYIKGFPGFTVQIVKNIQPKLEDIDKLYQKKTQKKLMKNRAKSIALFNAGKEDDFIYQSLVTKSMVEEVMNIAKYDCNVIIQGETGVGKEKVLSLIHQNSERHGNPCIKINCATIQESLAESEFFGYEPGAFTGAQATGKLGYFELANNGMLFLDEIGSLSMNMQSKLLRVIQESQFYRVGGIKQISVNVRVIVANNVPLKDMVESGTFREDLYYRLNICKIDVPPLRDRKDDILCLAEAFVNNWSKNYKIEKALSPGAISSLYNYYWPGNVRELENVIHRLIISSKGVVIYEEDIDEILNENAYGDMIVSVKKNFNQSENLDFHQLMEQQEKQIIEYALKKEGTTRKAADLLGLPQTTFARKKIKHGL